MCNIMIIKSNDDTALAKTIVIDYLKYLKVRGRDAYTVLIPGCGLFQPVETIDDVANIIYNKCKAFSSILLHARAIPETEKETTIGKPFIYFNGRHYIAHHGLIPDAEKYNPDIEIDSEVLLNVYQFFDYENPKEWFMESLKKYPRATTEIVYDSTTKKYIAATNFMPLYKKQKSSLTIYSTYKIDDEFCTVPSYSIEVV